MDLKQIEINDLLNSKKKFMLIDVRSPSEYEEFHIPGAVNLPLFSNEERAEVGTLYKQKGPEYAKVRGIEIFSHKLSAFYQEVRALTREAEQTVIYCWRGGMRSKSVANFMTVMGVVCWQLVGGIRSFRKLVTEQLCAFSQEKKPFVVIEGYTGSRKTDILKQLDDKGYPVIDLEGLAAHRGSIFGSVGLRPKSQKAFECGLWQRLLALKDAPYYIIEGESKRIGRVVLPSFINEGKERGEHIMIDYPFKLRIEAILEEYRPNENKEAINEAFSHLKKYLQPPLLEELAVALENEKYELFISYLLERYYDPRYRHKLKNYPRESKYLSMTSVDEGTEGVETILHNLFDTVSSLR